MTILVLMLASFSFLILQMLVSTRISIAGISPDFALLLVAYISLHRGSLQGTIFGFCIGLLQDLFNPVLLGLNALTKSLLGYIAGFVGSKTVPEGVLFLAFLFFLSKLGHDMVYLLFYTGMDLVRILTMLLTTTIPSAVYTAVIGVLIDGLCNFIGSKVVKTFGKAQQQR